ncbi:hypothetical protein BFJ69_g7825 [Fusarium oxysporum]|uniref:NAD(P)-binding domain-containing protein n=1 Tax=Fusarium oxysporum TaxID=5507 RepID=A0A420N4N8_FUSOX|nr:hypothetical protein BFJ69_g7825 [Fusarium oxysporum]
MAESRMQRPTIALLGCTGNTGKVVLRTLLDKPEYNLNIYARSAKKLCSQVPELADNDRVKMSIGDIHDTNVVVDCLSGASIIICTLGSDGMSPDTILGDSAQALVNALKVLKEQKGAAWEAPRLLYLSSASENERFSAPRPRFVHWMITKAFQMGYIDLQRAQRILLEDPSLCSLLLVQPNVLIDEPGTGTFISAEYAKLGCSYHDLGNAFVELATNDGYRKLETVAVSSADGDKALKYAPFIVSRLFLGFFVNFFPWGVQIHRFLERLW